MVGLDSLLRKFDDLPVRALAAVDSSLASSASDLEQNAKGRAPEESGEFRDKIEAGPVLMTSTQTEHEVVLGAPHSIHVEYGTSDREADPTIRPAFDETAPLAIVRAKKALKGAIR